jgi:predicted secreted protein
MKGTSIAAIYLLFWVLSAFLVMPFHVKTSAEAGADLVPGQAESAPHNFKPLRILMWTTLLATILFGLFYANYVQGWLTVEMLDFSNR